MTFGQELPKQTLLQSGNGQGDKSIGRRRKITHLCVAMFRRSRAAEAQLLLHHLSLWKSGGPWPARRLPLLMHLDHVLLAVTPPPPWPSTLLEETPPPSCCRSFYFQSHRVLIQYAPHQHSSPHSTLSRYCRPQLLFTSTFIFKSNTTGQKIITPSETFHSRLYDTTFLSDTHDDCFKFGKNK